MAERFDTLNKPGVTGQGRTGWAVGRFDWLNNPDSKVNRYWRVIEEGSEATGWPWQGQTIVGLWGPRAEPRGGLWGTAESVFIRGAGHEKFIPFFARRGQNLLGAARKALWIMMEGGHGASMDLLRVDAQKSRHPAGHFNPEAERKRLFFWLMTRATLEQIPFVVGKVTKPVEGQHYYQRALTSFDPMRVEMEELRRGVAGMLTGVDVTTRAGLATAREQVAIDTGSYRGARRSLSPGDAIGLTPAAKTGRAKTRVSTAPLPAALAQVTATAHVQDFLTDGKGRFSNGAWLDMIQGVNREVARRFQAAVVAQMKEDRKRPPTGALVRATQDDRNRYPQ